MQLSFSIKKATTADAEALTRLINIAYRGKEAEQGWTSEGMYLEGQRITEAGMLALLSKPDTENFNYIHEQGAILGFVSLQKKEGFIYLSFLTVWPAAQAAGIGKQLLAFSDRYAQSHHMPAIVITVLNIRHTLIAWYERRGYQRTGKEFPFPPEAGQPKVPVTLVEMRKEISGE